MGHDVAQKGAGGRGGAQKGTDMHDKAQKGTEGAAAFLCTRAVRY